MKMVLDAGKKKALSAPSPARKIDKKKGAKTFSTLYRAPEGAS
jgi:hypothetical protein